MSSAIPSRRSEENQPKRSSVPEIPKAVVEYLERVFGTTDSRATAGTPATEVYFILGQNHVVRHLRAQHDRQQQGV